MSSAARAFYASHRRSVTCITSAALDRPGRLAINDALSYGGSRPPAVRRPTRNREPVHATAHRKRAVRAVELDPFDAVGLDLGRLGVDRGLAVEGVPLRARGRFRL